MSSCQNQECLLENYIVIWLEWKMATSRTDFRQSIDQLQQVVSSIKKFVDIDECIDYITDIKSEKVFMIVSATIGEQSINIIQNIPQLYIIYVLDAKKTTDEHWMKNYHKVKHVFDSNESLCQILKDDIKRANTELTTISILSASSLIELNKLDQSFMYSQLLKEILLNRDYDEKQRTEFIKFCRIQYKGSVSMQEVINEFAETYSSALAIWWYTRDTFIYPMLNKALRTQDIAIVIKMGFFLRDLHRRIENLYLKSMYQSQPAKVYRGQGIFNTDFDRISKNKGGLLSFNNFLSTTLDRNIAFMRADSAQDDPELTGVLFEIEIDPSISRAPFASVDNLSYYADSEQEVLFSMHTVFRIGQLQQMRNRLWHVTLTLTDDDDEQLKHLSNFIREEINMQPEWAHLAVLMLRMGEYKKAEEICRAIQESTIINDLEAYVWCLNNLGNIMIEQGDQTNALIYLQKALEIKKQFLPSDHPLLVTAHNNIGLLYDSMRQYSMAFTHYELALKIQEKIPSANLHMLSTIHNNIGYLHHTMPRSIKTVSFTVRIRNVNVFKTDILRSYS